MNKLLKSVALLALLFSAGVSQAWPTRVQLTQAPGYTGEGIYVVLRFDKGSVTSSEADGNLYAEAQRAGVKKGSCFILETETEADVRFNAGPDKSLARSMTKVACKAK